MNCTWDMLSKELAIHGVKLLDENFCQLTHKGKVYKVRIDKAIRFIKKQINSNCKLFKTLWNEVTELLDTCDCQQTTRTSDVKIVNMFVSSINNLYTFASIMLQQFPAFREEHPKLINALEKASRIDYIYFSAVTIDTIIDYRISLDWVDRKNSILSYVQDLLSFASKGNTFVSSKIIKTARGISGPWSNMDLPMLERVFSWDDIDEEMRGRTRDKQTQRRYTKGFDHYNEPGVGEGHYWRELRNEPFSWYNKSTDSPYPSRSTLSKW
jgi:hypothetical protein